MKKIELPNGRLIGPGEPVFITAEIGINHNGSLDTAITLIKEAAKAGVDAVKFQNYDVFDFLSKEDITDDNIFVQCQLNEAGIRGLAEVAEDYNVLFYSTPTSGWSLSLLYDIGVPLIKVGSDFAEKSFIELMAPTGTPIIISIGGLEIEEIWPLLLATSHVPTGLLYCVSEYPTSPQLLNLRKIPAMEKMFGVPVGFSDHSLGYHTAIAAVALGACMIEKHFTLDHGLDGPDHKFSATPVEMAELVKGVREVEASLGSSDARLNKAELEARNNFTRSCVANGSAAKGEVITREMVSFVRPGTGIPPDSVGFLEGRFLNRNMKVGEQILACDVD